MMEKRTVMLQRQACVVSFWFLVIILGLQGCALKHEVPLPERIPQKEIPPPTPQSVPIPVPPSEPLPMPAPEPEVSRQSVPVPQEGKAAATLLASARQNRESGRLGQAEMILERALRVEPRNARLWYEMAQIKFDQREYRQAVQFCIKSKSLAGRDYDLIEQNRVLMEKASRELGEPVSVSGGLNG